MREGGGRTQADQCHAPPSTGFLGSPDGKDVLPTGEQCLDAAAQSARPLAVHHLHQQDARRPALGEVGVEQCWDVGRTKEMEVEPAVERKRNWSDVVRHQKTRSREVRPGAGREAAQPGAREAKKRAKA